MESAHDAVTARLWQDYHAGVARFRVANPDIAGRFAREGGAAYYDPDEDLFILLLGALAPCAILELSDVLSVRVDPETYHLLGFEIPSVAAFVAAHPEAGTMLRAAIAPLRDQPGTFVPCLPPVGSEVADELRELALA